MTRLGRRLARTAVMAALAVVAPPVIAHPGHGTHMSLEEMTRRAGLIVEGRVAEVACAWNADQTRIYTTVTIDVTRYLKNGVAEESITFSMLGGVVDDVAMWVSVQPEFARGEEVLLFLDPAFVRGEYPAVNAQHGKFRLTRDEQTGVVSASNGLETMDKTELVAVIERSKTANERMVPEKLTRVEGSPGRGALNGGRQR